MNNLFDQLPTSVPHEITTTLASGKDVRIERIISTGHSSAADSWYDQDEREWVIVLSGEAELMFAGDAAPIRLKPGDYIDIAPHRRHRVHWTTPDEPTVWLAVFIKERE